MKILLIALPTTLDYLVPLLTDEGHTVQLITGNEEVTLTDNEGNDYQVAACGYLPRGTSAEINYVTGIIGTFEPDVVVNAITNLFLPSSSDYTYLGNTEASAQLETHKWAARTKAGTLGWLLPTLAQSDITLSQVVPNSATTYIKPTDNSTPGTLGTVKIPANSDMDTEVLPELGPDYNCFVELGVDYAVEAWCFFTMRDGEYSIIRTLGCTGYGNEKLLSNLGNSWRTGITLVDLTSDQSTAFLAKCEAWLDYAKTLGGSYEGTIGGAITDTNEVYWFEQNSRPGTENIGMLPGTATNWLNGLTTDSSLSINQISAGTIRSEKGFG
jgi:hypothetical protein